MEEPPKLPRRLFSQCLEDATHMALVRESGVGSQPRQVCPPGLEDPACELNSQAVHVVGHRAAVVLPEDARKMDRMHVHSFRQIRKGEAFAERLVHQVARSAEPAGAIGLIVELASAHALEHVAAKLFHGKRAQAAVSKSAIQAQSQPGQLRSAEIGHKFGSSEVRAHSCEKTVAQLHAKHSRAAVADFVRMGQ